MGRFSKPETDETEEEAEQVEQEKPKRQIVPAGWEFVQQPAFQGYKNEKGEIISTEEAIAMILTKVEEIEHKL